MWVCVRVCLRSHVVSCEGERADPSRAPSTPVEDWFKPLLSECDASVLEHSGKMVLLMKILQMAEDLGDKVYVHVQTCCESSVWMLTGGCLFPRLVFSQSLSSLGMIEDFLKVSHCSRSEAALKGSYLLLF